MKRELKPLGDNFAARSLAALYGLVIARRNQWYERHKDTLFSPPTPTISVGGIHAGGTGKTPLTAFITDYLLNKRQCEVAILSRGYGRNRKEPVVVAPNQDATWMDVGDEPAMIHASLPRTWLGIGADRCLSARRLLKEMNSPSGTSAFVLDDGFQHRRIARHLDILCIPPMSKSPLLMPAGLLREPVKNMSRADFACIIGSKNDLEEINWTQRLLRSQLGNDFPVFTLLSKPVEWVNLRTGEKRSRLKNKPWALVSGIARPQRFVKTVNHMGVKPVFSTVFPDHHVFTQKEIDAVFHQNIAGIVTTEKDAGRIRTLNLVNDKEIWYLKISLNFLTQMDQDTFFNKIDSVFSFSRNRRNPS